MGLLLIRWLYFKESGIHLKKVTKEGGFNRKKRDSSKKKLALLTTNKVAQLLSILIYVQEGL